ncbi:hypothetical protein [Mesorhizobium sp. M0767]|uniref:hypothetical protein n=1 Tax=Mesorhizobium sp. M0767 TaxID=2956995 RepID=UPI00333CD71D
MPAILLVYAIVSLILFVISVVEDIQPDELEGPTLRRLFLLGLIPALLAFSVFLLIGDLQADEDEDDDEFRSLWANFAAAW